MRSPRWALLASKGSAISIISSKAPQKNNRSVRVNPLTELDPSKECICSPVTTKPLACHVPSIIPFSITGARVDCTQKARKFASQHRPVALPPFAGHFVVHFIVPCPSPNLLTFFLLTFPTLPFLVLATCSPFYTLHSRGKTDGAVMSKMRFGARCARKGFSYVETRMQRLRRPPLRRRCRAAFRPRRVLSRFRTARD